MAKGSEAKLKIFEKLQTIYPDVFEFDKKYYVYEYENGERIQIAISLTCPKNPIEVATEISDNNGDWDFTDSKPKSAVAAINNAPPAEITETEIQNIAEMMKRLGL